MRLSRAFFIFVIILVSRRTSAQPYSSCNVEYFKPVSNLQIWALQAVSESKVWFAGKRGVWGYTEDAGKSWHIDSIKADTVYPMFRNISVLNDSTVLLLSAASPAYLFKTTNKGKTWRLVYKNSGKDIFFDSMIFYDSAHGIALGDPVDGCFQLIKTDDAGETWKQVDCAGIPKALPGEGCFAASNTCINIHSNSVWFASGGIHTRVFHSDDFGSHFTAHNTPLPQGEQMTGIFSIDFLNKSTGVIAGGNYNKTDSSITGLAITRDGGQTWKPVKTDKPFFGACVQFRNPNEVFVTGADGTYCYNIKTGITDELKDKSGAALKFGTLRFSPSGKALWMANPKGQLALMNLDK
jgi:photosystem II stability/assembly factor-like uncharacterized protein